MPTVWVHMVMSVVNVHDADHHKDRLALLDVHSLSLYVKRIYSYIFIYTYWNQTRILTTNQHDNL